MAQVDIDKLKSLFEWIDAQPSVVYVPLSVLDKGELNERESNVEFLEQLGD